MFHVVHHCPRTGLGSQHCPAPTPGSSITWLGEKGVWQSTEVHPSTQKSFLGICSRTRTSPNGPSQRQHLFLEEDLQFYDLALKGEPR